MANSKNLSVMENSQLLSVADVARLYKKSVQTIYRHISAGKLSRDSGGLIQLSELLRVYGAIPQADNQVINSVKPDNNENIKQVNLDVISLLQEKINRLELDIVELKTESKEQEKQALAREQQAIEREERAVEREKRLMALLEHKSSRDSSGGLFGKFFK